MYSPNFEYNTATISIGASGTIDTEHTNHR